MFCTMLDERYVNSVVTNVEVSLARKGKYTIEVCNSILYQLLSMVGRVTIIEGRWCELFPIALHH